MLKVKTVCDIVTYKLLQILTKSNLVKVERTNTWETDKLVLSDKDNFELFYFVAKSVLDDKRTLLGYDRLLTIWKVINYVAKNAINYAVAEIGVYKGGSSLFIAESFKEYGVNAPVYCFDTFTGHPNNLSQYDVFHVKGGFGDVVFKDVQKYLSQCDNITIVQGDFRETSKTLLEMKYGFVHIDVDTYLPTLKCLTYFGERLVDNGVILLDDFNSPTCLGVKKAVTDYLDTTKVKYLIGGGLQTKQLALFKM
jgi:cephalosporin hydroxylase